jgi:DNA polymerase I
MYKNGWELAERHVTDLLEILRVMSERGLNIDLDRLDAFNTELDKQMAVYQTQFDSHPDLHDIRNLHPKHKDGTVGYKRTPKDTTEMELIYPGKADMPYRWAKRKPFLATSKDQVTAYAREKGHEVPKDRDTGKDTTGQKALILMARKYKDPIYKDFVAMRKLVKLKGTYGKWPMTPIEGTRLAKVHTIYTLRPITGRLSSLRPNLQNVPKDGPLAKQFKGCLVASPGHKIVRGDLVSAEAVIMGFLCGDPELIRWGKLGIHKIAMARYLHIPVDLSPERPEKETKEELDAIKDKADPALYRKIKVGVYGAFYLVGAQTQFEQNPDVFDSIADAKKFTNFCLSISAKVPAYQRRIIEQVRMSKYYQNPFGHRIEFWDAAGADGPAIVAAGPQSIVASVMKECMVQLWGMEAGQWMILQVHDELAFDAPANKVELVKTQLTETMEQPWPQLGGLVIPCEVKVTDSMA